MTKIYTERDIIERALRREKVDFLMHLVGSARVAIVGDYDGAFLIFRQDGTLAAVKPYHVTDGKVAEASEAATVEALSRRVS